MANVKITTLGTGELHARLKENPIAIFQDAYKHGCNMSAWLERLNPSEAGDGSDAFGRQLREAEIVPTSDPVAGYWASPASDFLRDQATRTLLSEFMARTWRRISVVKPSATWQNEQRAIYLSGDGAEGSWQRPYSDAQEARWNQRIAAAIPLQELIAITTPIEGDLYRSFYLTYSAAELRAFRVGESAEIPIAKLADAEHTINLQKFGRGLRASYEQMRRMRVDKLAMQIQFMAIQAENDKVAAVLNIIVNGDGNSSTSATNHNLTALDADATAGTLTLKGWLAFKLKFANPYNLNVTLMQEAVALQLQLLNAGSANIPLVSLTGGFIGSLTPINRFADNVGFGWTTDAPALTIVGIDSNWSMEQVTEIGGDIAEMERFITNQTHVMTMSEVEGYAVLDATAARTLSINA